MKGGNKQNNSNSLKKLVIDALIFEDKKAYGYQEYLFNLLNYFYNNIEQILFDQIIIACEVSQTLFFEKFSDKFKIVGFRASGRLKLLIVQCQLKKKLNLTENDVILNTYNYSAFLKQCKTVLVIHDLLYLRPQLLPNLLMRMQRNLLVPLSIINSDLIISISKFTKKDILESYAIARKKNIEVIYNYFDFDKYGSYKMGKSNQMKPFYLSVSSNFPHKNIVTLLKAYELVVQSNSNCPNLVLVGKKGKMDKICKSFYESLSKEIVEKIHFKENISNAELGYLYSSCECFILPTLFEGLGMPIIEAYYFKAHLVLSNLEICREIVDNNASFFEPLDYNRLSEILLSKEYVYYSDGLSVLNRYNSSNTSEKYIHALNKL